MVEDISKIISNGFDTYLKNLNLSIPFILDLFISGIFAFIMFIAGFFFILGSALSSLENITEPEQFFLIILPLLRQHIFEIVFFIALSVIVLIFIRSFFIAGAIGMAKQATEAGKSDLSTMMDAGKKNVVNLFFAEILVGLATLAGVVFLVPGALQTDLDRLSFSDSAGPILLLIGGLVIWGLYILILNIILAVFRYALVVENLGPVEGVLRGLRFFSHHKLDVFLVWLFLLVVGIILSIIGQIMGFIPVINIIWFFISMIISLFVIPALATIWWVRLYMTRTDMKIYFNELLAHPDELNR